MKCCPANRYVSRSCYRESVVSVVGNRYLGGGTGDSGGGHLSVAAAMDQSNINYHAEAARRFSIDSGDVRADFYSKKKKKKKRRRLVLGPNLMPMVLGCQEREIPPQAKNKRAMALYTCVDKGNKSGTGFWQPPRPSQPPKSLRDQI